jgi:hypothetical protein
MATTQAQDVQVNSADPSSAEQGTVDLDVEISGGGFDKSSVVEFFLTGTSKSGGINVKKVKVRGSKKIIATIDVDSEAVVDDFDIEISLSSGRRGRGTTLFSVKKKHTDKAETELIEFTGDLVGYDDSVEGCCPNAGPFPRYAMTLVRDLGDFAAGYYEGYLFINAYGAGRNRQYKVQFWNDDIAIEIIGGVIDNDKKNKVLTVTFTDEDCMDLFLETKIATVSFVLTRTPS